MIRTINEWKKYKRTVEEVDPGLLDDDKKQTFPKAFGAIKQEPTPEVKAFVDYVVLLGLDKAESLKLVSTVFIDPAQAPDEVSVVFVQENLSDITHALQIMEESEFQTAANAQYTDAMLNNDDKHECLIYAPNNKKLQQLSDALNAQIKRADFNAVYENGIFFINSLDSLNEGNRKIVVNIIKEANGKNLSDNIKWKRKLA